MRRIYQKNSYASSFIPRLWKEHGRHSLPRETFQEAHTADKQLKRYDDNKDQRYEKRRLIIQYVFDLDPCSRNPLNTTPQEKCLHQPSCEIKSIDCKHVNQLVDTEANGNVLKEWDQKGEKQEKVSVVVNAGSNLNTKSETENHANTQLTSVKERENILKKKTGELAGNHKGETHWKADYKEKGDRWDQHIKAIERFINLCKFDTKIHSSMKFMKKQDSVKKHDRIHRKRDQKTGNQVKEQENDVLQKTEEPYTDYMANSDRWEQEIKVIEQFLKICKADTKIRSDNYLRKSDKVLESHNRKGHQTFKKLEKFAKEPIIKSLSMPFHAAKSQSAKANKPLTTVKKLEQLAEMSLSMPSHTAKSQSAKANKPLTTNKKLEQLPEEPIVKSLPMPFNAANNQSTKANKPLTTVEKLEQLAEVRIVKILPLPVHTAKSQSTKANKPLTNVEKLEQLAKEPIVKSLSMPVHTAKTQSTKANKSLTTVEKIEQLAEVPIVKSLPMPVHTAKSQSTKANKPITTVENLEQLAKESIVKSLPMSVHTANSPLTKANKPLTTVEKLEQLAEVPLVKSLQMPVHMTKSQSTKANKPLTTVEKLEQLARKPIVRSLPMPVPTAKIQSTKSNKPLTTVEKLAQLAELRIVKILPMPVHTAKSQSTKANKPLTTVEKLEQLAEVPIVKSLPMPVHTADSQSSKANKPLKTVEKLEKLAGVPIVKSLPMPVHTAKSQLTKSHKPLTSAKILEQLAEVPLVRIKNEPLYNTSTKSRIVILYQQRESDVTKNTDHELADIQLSIKRIHQMERRNKNVRSLYKRLER